MSKIYPPSPSFAAIFDCDGVLVDSEPVSLESFRQTYVEAGAPVTDDDIRQAIGRTDEAVAEAMEFRYSCGLSAKEFVRRKQAKYEELARERGIPAFEGAVELVDALKAAGVPCAVASSGHEAKIRLNLRMGGLDGRFDVIVDGGEVAAGKPAPNMFLEAARRLGLPPARCVVIEDSEAGVQAARAAGMACVAVTNTFSADRLHGAEWIVSSLREIEVNDLRRLAQSAQPTPPAPQTDTKSSIIRRMFSTIAPRYDLLNHLLSFGIDRRWRRRAVRESADARTHRVLDVCAGTADLGLEYLKAIGLQGFVVGADFAGPMLQRAAHKAIRAERQNQMAFLEADGLRLPLRDRTFDVTAIAFGLRNMADWRRGIAEMARVTRPGGRVAILEFTLPPNPIIRRLYLFYFLRVLPLVGRLISGTQAYSYLPLSVLDWPAPEALAQAMREAGLAPTRFERLTFGIACLHIGVVGD